MLASKTTQRLITRRSALVTSGPRRMATAKATITEGVEFDTVAREWRMKWSGDNEKASLASVQKVLDSMKAEIKAVPGVKSVQRVVCGGCLDYKVVVALDAGKYGDWEKAAFAPEGKFLAAVKEIPGVSTVETQTYTLMPIE